MFLLTIFILLNVLIEHFLKCPYQTYRAISKSGDYYVIPIKRTTWKIFKRSLRNVQYDLNVRGIIE